MTDNRDSKIERGKDDKKDGLKATERDGDTTNIGNTHTDDSLTENNGTLLETRNEA